MNTNGCCTWLLAAAVVFALALPPKASADSGPIVALFDMEDRGSKLNKEVLSNLIDYLAARLTEGGFQVVPTDQIRMRLKSSRAESHKRCYDQGCQIELGRELSAQKTLSTKILRIGDTCQVTAVMYDLKKATTETAATAEAICEVNKLLEAVKKIAFNLCAPLKHARREADAKLAEYDELVKNAASEKAEKERAERAWQKVMSIAGDEQVPSDIRVQALQKYKQDFQKPNPHLEEVENLLSDLNLGTLVVRTVPAGAQVSLNGGPAMVSPVTAKLKAGKYRLVASLEGYGRLTSEAKVEAGKNLEVKLTLARGQASGSATASAATEGPPTSLSGSAPSRPMPAMKLWGHVTFWSGIGAAGLAGVSAALASKYGADSDQVDQSKTWGGVFWASSAAAVGLITTGIVLWLLAPDAAEATTAAVGPAPQGGGLIFSLGGRW